MIAPRFQYPGSEPPWTPNVKPRFNARRLRLGNGPLSRGLIFTLLFDGTSRIPVNIATPNDAVTATGTFTYGTNSLYGPTVASTSGRYTTTLNPNTNILTCSTRAFFPLANNGSLLVYSGTNLALYDQPTARFATSLGASGDFGNAITAGWRRIHIVFNGTTIQLYQDGVPWGAAFTGNLTTGAFNILSDGSNNFTQPVADFFLWSRALSAAEVLAHHADPYGTTLRPRWEPTVFPPPPNIVSGTLNLTQAAQTLSAAGTVPGVSGGLTVTQANETLSAAGTVLVSGTLSQTQANETLSAAGGPRVGGTLSATQANETIAATGGPVVAGTLTTTQAAETLSATGSVISGISGNLNLTQAAQTLSAAGNVASLPPITAVLSLVQASQIVVAQAQVSAVTGALTATQGDQHLSASGRIGSGSGARVVILA